MIKLAAVILAVGAVASSDSVQESSVSGEWLLSANVSNNAYNLMCRFKQNGSRLGGSCAEAKIDGTITDKEHSLSLTAGRVEGDHVFFTHRAQYLLARFDVNYDGVLEGDRITGKIAVFGHHGVFTAIREESGALAAPSIVLASFAPHERP